MKRLVVLMCISLGLATQPVTALAEDGPDLAAYIESIRASGMTETAKSQIRSVASIVAGATILTYRPDPSSGRYWPSYMSATCPKPDADEPELTQWKMLKMSDTDQIVIKLRPFADADGSGFVTTEEGSAFRDLMEFGYLAAQAVRDESPSMEAIARASGKEPDAAQARLREYEAISKRIAEAGVSDLPVVEVAGATRKSD